VASNTRATAGGEHEAADDGHLVPVENMSGVPEVVGHVEHAVHERRRQRARTSGSESVTAAATTTMRSARFNSPTSRIRLLVVGTVG